MHRSKTWEANQYELKGKELDAQMPLHSLLQSPCSRAGFFHKKVPSRTVRSILPYQHIAAHALDVVHVFRKNKSTYTAHMILVFPASIRALPLALGISPVCRSFHVSCIIRTQGARFHRLTTIRSYAYILLRQPCNVQVLVIDLHCVQDEVITAR